MVAVTAPDTSSEMIGGDVLEGLQDHFSAPRVASEFIITQEIAVRNPNHHITRFAPQSCDLFGYAKAGHAECEMITEDDRFYTTLIYRVGSSDRMEQRSSPGDIDEHVSFAAHTYTWQGIRFLVYEFSLVSARGAREQLSYILAPRSEGTIETGKHSKTVELIMAAGQWSNQLHDEVYVFDAGQWIKSSSLWKSVQSSSWDNVILDNDMKANLIEDVQGFFDSMSLYKEFQVPWKRGIIFHGLPGNGKTISIKALMAALQAREDPVPSLYVKSFEACQGQQYSIRAIFGRARAMAPCLLIFEDLDSLITDKTRSYFLNEVDGLESNDGILMIGSTNHLDKLDPAIRDRPSRFDRKYHYKLPGQAERAAYARYWRTKLAKNPRIEFPEPACDFIASMTDGFSFAYLQELFVAALLVVARGGKGDEKPTDAATSVFNSVSSTAPTDSTGAQGSPEGDGVVGKAGDVAQTVEAEAAMLRARALGALEIPDGLQDNVLVKVMRQQVKMLLGEMDNSMTAKKISSVVDTARDARLRRPIATQQAVPV